MLQMVILHIDTCQTDVKMLLDVMICHLVLNYDTLSSHHTV